MSKKIIFLLISLTAVFMLASCSPDNKKTDDPEKTELETETQSDVSSETPLIILPTPEPSDAPKLTEEEMINELAAYKQLRNTKNLPVAGGVLWCGANDVYSVEKMWLEDTEIGKLEEISSGTLSTPEISPNKQKFAFLDEYFWEGQSNLYLYDINAKTKTKCLITDIPENHKPNHVIWLDDENLLVIGMLSTGTVTFGGDVYVYNIYDKTSKKIIKGFDITVQIISTSLEGDKITLAIMEYIDDNMIESKDYDIEVPVSDVRDLISGAKETLVITKKE